MKVVNIHQRVLDAPIATIGQLIDGLASANDRLWPHDRWPAMRFDRPLGVGALGGHGPIGYVVESYAPGRNIRFRFIEPQGFVGSHRFEAEAIEAAKTRLRHTIDMQATGRSWLVWALAIRPLHDALLEDLLDRAEVFAGKELPGRKWSRWVRIIRWAMRRRRITRTPASKDGAK
jgi:hypothetical protein